MRLWPLSITVIPEFIVPHRSNPKLNVINVVSFCSKWSYIIKDLVKNKLINTPSNSSFNVLYDNRAIVTEAEDTINVFRLSQGQGLDHWVNIA